MKGNESANQNSQLTLVDLISKQPAPFVFEFYDWHMVALVGSLTLLRFQGKVLI